MTLPGRRPLAHARTIRPEVVDWNAAWQVAWKANPANAWFRHQADVLTASLATGGTAGDGRVLKTDAFEEACGLPTPPAVARAESVLIDVSPRILAQAARARRVRDDRARLCAMDLRRLALRPESFDLVLSHSTMDHFSDDRDIGLALGEILGVLRRGGRLLVTLDNPHNPLLLARRVLHRLAGPVGGLIPFPMGRTLSRARLRAVLEREGFVVVASGYLLHTPRVVGLWAAEWAARRGLDRLGRRLRTLFGVAERLLGALPTRGLTGHFVFADCRRPDA